MTNYKLTSWNVNGIRSLIKKDFWEILKELDTDVLAVQETKSDDEVMKKLKVEVPEYQMFWHSHQLKKGYSGVATLSRIPVSKQSTGFGIPEFDQEGRVVVSKYAHFTLLNIYFPNGGQGPHRVEYKMQFYKACLDYCQQLRQQGEKVIICGDVNTAHQEIDLHDPKGNQKTSGFLPIEREWIDKLLEHDYVDTFRHLNPEAKDVYTWWDMRTISRPKNKGWRIDYFFVTKDLLPNITNALVLTDVHGSDHCPIQLELSF
jgi:exodeoxyribonuclease III